MYSPDGFKPVKPQLRRLIAHILLFTCYILLVQMWPKKVILQTLDVRRQFYHIATY